MKSRDNESESSIEEDFDEESSEIQDDSKELTESEFEHNILKRNDNPVHNEMTKDINIFNFDADKQVSKATSVKNQLIISENLLETRIKLQKLLSASNRLPQGNDYDSAKNSKFLLLKELFEDVSKGVKRLGKLLLEIDNFVSIEPKDDPYSKEKRKAVNFDDSSLSKRFCGISANYRSVIENWHERTKFVNPNMKLKKFDSFEICPTKSIDQILTDKPRLIERTRLKRSEFNIIGQVENSDAKTTEKYNDDIYNDDDFYHQLLKQIMESKVDELNESTAMSKKYIEIQRMRNKLKKQVDTRASKGRKIRYDVHEKLVNFMAPVDTTKITDEAKSELFKSLFGNFNMQM